MRHLSKRLDRLEAQRDGYAIDGLSVILFGEPDGEVMAALFMDGSNASRLDHETESAFIARVTEGMT